MSRSTPVIGVLVSLIALSAATSCRRADPSAEVAEIERVIASSIGWALTKDTVALFNAFVHDSTFFIFHPTLEPTVEGWAEFVPLVDTWLNPAFKATHFEVKQLRITFSRSGTVAWYSALLDDFGEWDGQPIGWEDVRWTGVLEKREGRWLIMQMHFSFAEEQIRGAEAQGDG